MQPTTAPTDAEGLVAFWADSPFPADRRHVLQLWREESGELVLTTATRWTPSATWPPSVVVRRGVTPAIADAAAATLGLVRYLDAPAVDTGGARDRRRWRRARAYAKGREAARRMPLGERERRIARYLAGGVGDSDQGRAYWLGVIREARS